jgi:hypothetical protein
MAIFNSKLFVYQRVKHFNPARFDYPMLIPCFVELGEEFHLQCTFTQYQLPISKTTPQLKILHQGSQAEWVSSGDFGDPKLVDLRCPAQQRSIGISGVSDP